MVKVQPATWPRVIDELPPLVEAIEDAGSWGFNTEGLKLRVTMGEREQALFRQAFGNVRDNYRNSVGVREDGDWVLRDDLKARYITLAEKLARKAGLKYFSADNSPLGRGDGFECCGTEGLRDYRVFTYNKRSRAFGIFWEDELCKCVLNFTRATTTNRTVTLGEAVRKRLGPVEAS